MRLGCSLAFGLVLLAACSQEGAKPPALAVEHASPELSLGAPPLLLNDSITVYFSSPLLPLSVTTDSFTVLDEAGHQVPGNLRTSSNWVTFVPDPPLSPALDDGSFLPGAKYRLWIAGSPRPDAIRSLTGVRLQSSVAYEFRVANAADRPNGLPAPLRPSGDDVPFLLNAPEVPPPLAADAPRLLLHFTQPVLPTSVRPEAFEVLLHRLTPVALQPRSVRLVTSRLDHRPGSTVEIDLGALPMLAGTDERTRLAPGEWVIVSLRRDRASLLDFAGNPPLATEQQLWWSVVAGASIALAEWPGLGDELDDATGLTAGFEVDRDGVRPRVRVEAGDGSLGVFRPKVDTTLTPGVAFDRGDGVRVLSQEARFPFQAIDIPAGVTVSVDGASGAQLLALGDIRIAGTLRLRGPGFAIPPMRTLPMPGNELFALAPVAVFAAGDVVVDGVVEAETQTAEGTAPFWIGAADQVQLNGPVPFQTMLVVEPRAESELPRLTGSRGQSQVRFGAFRQGCAASETVVRAMTPWRQMARDHDGGVLHLDVDAGIVVAWQTTPPDPVRPKLPNVAFGSAGRLHAAGDRDAVAVPGGHFLRLELTASVTKARPLPVARELRVCER